MIVEPTVRQLIRETWTIRDHVRQAITLLEKCGVGGSYYALRVTEYEEQLTEDLRWFVKAARQEAQ